MSAGSSQEAIALCSMNFRNPPPWRQGIHQTVCQKVQTSKWPRDQVMWVIIHPGEVASWLGRKGVPFCTLSTKLSTPNLPLEAPPNLALEHLSMLEGKRKDDCPSFWVIRPLESSTMWWKNQTWLLLKKEINFLLCKLSNIYFSQKENSIISPRFTIYLLNDRGQIILAL